MLTWSGKDPVSFQNLNNYNFKKKTPSVSVSRPFKYENVAHNSISKDISQEINWCYTGKYLY